MSANISTRNRPSHRRLGVTPPRQKIGAFASSEDKKLSLRRNGVHARNAKSSRAMHKFVAKEDAAKPFMNLGLDTNINIDDFRNVDQLYDYMHEEFKKHNIVKSVTFKNLSSHFNEAKLQARKLEYKARTKVSKHDPVASMYKAFPRKAFFVDPKIGIQPEVAESDIPDYVEPSSIQSTMSPAAYLSYIYNLAKNEITTNYTYALDTRRPDLATFVLSDENLQEEVSTLQIVNETLTAQLLSANVAPDEDTLFSAFVSTRYPFALPFHLQNCTTRESLNAISGLNLNKIAIRGQQNVFAISQTAYNIVPNAADRLHLYPDHIAMLSEVPDSDTLYTDWFGCSDSATANGELQFSDRFCDATGISFAQFRELVRDDVNVRDESGKHYKGIYSLFLNGGWLINLIEQADGRYKTQGYTHEDESTVQDLPAFVHTTMNKCVRLQTRCGLQFYELDWILSNAYYSHESYSQPDDAEHNEVLEDGTAVNVLAHFMEWNEIYSLTVDQFSAMLADINCYTREGSNLMTLMRQLFGDDAGEVTLKTRRYASEGAVTVADIDSAESGLGNILRRGFKLTSSEWASILSQVSKDDTELLDSLLMGRIYRLATLYRLFGWSILQGIYLTSIIDGNLMSTLATSNVCSDVLTAMDQMKWLAEWMSENNLALWEVIVMTIPSEDISSKGLLSWNQDILNWVEDSKMNLSSTLVTDSDFMPYTAWDAGGESIEISADSWLASLQTSVLDVHGFVTGTQVEIETAVREILANASAEYSLNQVQADSLVLSLSSKQDQQHGVIDAQLAKRETSLSKDDVAPLLLWMGSNYHLAETTLFEWDTANNPSNTEGLLLVYETYRHALVVGKLQMTSPEISLPVTHASWIGNDVGTAHSLKQLFFLSRFKCIQNALVSANQWLGYFQSVENENSANGGIPLDDQTGNYSVLSKLLDWPANEIATLAVGADIGIVGGCISTVQQADFLFRRICICKDASVCASELLSLETANGDSPDWPAACSASLIGLGRYLDGIYISNAEGSIGEV